METDENYVEVYRCTSDLEANRALVEVLEPGGVEAFLRDRTTHAFNAPDSEAGGYFIAVAEGDAGRARDLLLEALEDEVLDEANGEVIEEETA